MSEMIVAANAINALRAAGIDRPTLNEVEQEMIRLGVPESEAAAEVSRLMGIINNPQLDPELQDNETLEVPNQITDTRVAEYFAKHCHNARYWQDVKKWLTYDGMRWNTDTPGGPFPLLKETFSSLYEVAREIADDTQRQNVLKGVVSLESYHRQETVLKAASVVPEMIVQSSQLDQDPMILNCLNGTIDLRTGKIKPHSPNDYITRLVPIEYNPEAECPTFFKFLDRIFEGNKNLIAYLQRWIGYCLTGKTGEQVLVFFYGTGSNGKSTLTTIIEKLLGDFASTACSDLLMYRDRKTATNDLAGLRGSRLVKVSEFNVGERLNEATVKTLTGGDIISARFLYSEFFQYLPQFKIILLGNYKPKIKGRDHGIWRRIHLVPFNVTIPDHEKDKSLDAKLHAELPGILSWAVRGCLEWQSISLQPPDEVREAVEAYKQSEDIFQQWISECCNTGPSCRATAKELLDSFIEFSNWRNISSTKFGRLLSEEGFTKEKSNRVLWCGIEVSSEMGGLGQWDSFKGKSYRKNDIEKFTQNTVNYPNLPNTPENEKNQPEQIDLEALPNFDF